jgi:hypothetical protein
MIGDRRVQRGQFCGVFGDASSKAQMLRGRTVSLRQFKPQVVQD